MLVFHTHASESYTPDAAFPYTPTETERTTDTRYNVVRVGDELCTALEKRGIETLHIRSLFDTPTYAGSYDRSLAAVEQALEENPSVKVVIDLHRDSILTDEGEAYKTSCTVDGAETAQLMFVVGTDAGGLYHPDWRDNLNFVSTPSSTRSTARIRHSCGRSTCAHSASTSTQAPARCSSRSARPATRCPRRSPPCACSRMCSRMR